MVIGYYEGDTTKWVEVFNDQHPRIWEEQEMGLYKDSIYLRTGVQWMEDGKHQYGGIEVQIEWIEAMNLIYTMEKVYGDKYFAI